MSRPTVPKPVACPVQPESIPAEMKARAQWVCWRWTWKPPTARAEGKWDKPPFNARTKRHASSTDTSTWSPFETALAAYRDARNGYDGIGYVFSGELDDFVGVDLDKCRDPETGQIRPWSEEQRLCKHWATIAPEPTAIVEAMQTYGEVSPSGTGVKLIVRGSLARGMKHGDIEMYSSGRYFTVTGHVLPECQPAIANYDGLSYLQQLFCVATTGASKQKRDRKPKTPPHPPEETTTSNRLPTPEQIIAACHNANNGDKFRRLLNGETTEYQSQSEADLALCSIVAFWAAGNAALIDKVFRQSKLYRDKWDEARGDETYGQRSIRTALETCTRFFDWSKVIAAPVTVGCLTLVVKKVRRTPAKITVHVEVQKDGKPIDLIKLTDSPSSRKEAIKAIVARIPDEPDAKGKASEALGQILVDAARHQENDGKSGCNEIHEILAEYVPGEIVEGG